MEEDPAHAVLPPPVSTRFRQLTGIGDAPLEARFDGWSKVALLTPDTAYLFPRRGRDEALRFNADVCEALAERGVAAAPKVLGRWDEFEEVAGPCVAFARCRGRHWMAIEADVSFDEVTTMAASLGRAIGSWHRLAVDDLPPALRRRASFDPKPTLSALLSADLATIVDEGAHRFGASPAWRDAWSARIEAIAALPDVFLHGDVCENQLFVDDAGRVETVIDWDTAGLGHPLHDFDFGEWGLGIYEWEARFDELRTAMWEQYVAARADATLPGADDVNLAFALADFVYLARHRDAGTLDDWRTKRLGVAEAALRRQTMR